MKIEMYIDDNDNEWCVWYVRACVCMYVSWDVYLWELWWIMCTTHIWVKIHLLH